jgi:hypothetical protein
MLDGRVRWRRVAAGDEIQDVMLAPRVSEEPAKVAKTDQISETNGAPLENDRPVLAFATEHVCGCPRASLIGRGSFPPARRGHLDVIAGLCYRTLGELHSSNTLEGRPCGSELKERAILVSLGAMRSCESQPRQRSFIGCADFDP